MEIHLNPGPNDNLPNELETIDHCKLLILSLDQFYNLVKLKSFANL